MPEVASKHNLSTLSANFPTTEEVGAEGDFRSVATKVKPQIERRSKVETVTTVASEQTSALARREGGSEFPGHKSC